MICNFLRLLYIDASAWYCLRKLYCGGYIDKYSFKLLHGTRLVEKWEVFHRLYARLFSFIYFKKWVTIG